MGGNPQPTSTMCDDVDDDDEHSYLVMPDGGTVSEYLSRPLETCAGPLYMSAHAVHRFKERVMGLHRNVPFAPWHAPILAGILAAARPVKSFRNPKGFKGRGREEARIRRELKQGYTSALLGVEYSPGSGDGWLIPYAITGRDVRSTVLTIYPVRKLVFK